VTTPHHPRQRQIAMEGDKGRGRRSHHEAG
jgi:hypothetical protein